MAGLCLRGHNPAMAFARSKKNLSRFRQLDGADKWLLLRAVVWLLVARIMIGVFSFRRVAAWLSATSEGPNDEPDAHLLGRVSYAVGAAANHVPWRSDCFPQTIAARMLLKGYGYRSTIHLGVEKSSPDSIAGHAWLTCGEEIVTGGDQAGRYAEIHRLGG